MSADGKQALRIKKYRDVEENDSLIRSAVSDGTRQCADQKSDVIALLRVRALSVSCDSLLIFHHYTWSEIQLMQKMFHLKVNAPTEWDEA